MRRSLLTVTLALASAAAITACGSSGTAGVSSSGNADTQGQDNSPPYRVLVTGGLSSPGGLADNAETSVLAAKAGAKLINSHGGVDGRRVIVTAVDDDGSASTAVTYLLGAIHSGTKPDLYLDSGPSTITAAVLPILTANHILSFNTSPTADSADPAKFPLNFDLAPTPADDALGFIPTIKAAGYKRIGIIFGNDDYGTPYAAELKRVFTTAGLTVTASQPYDVSALNMTPQLQAVQATRPDALVMDAYGPAVATF